MKTLDFLFFFCFIDLTRILASNCTVQFEFCRTNIYKLVIDAFKLVLVDPRRNSKEKKTFYRGYECHMNLLRI